MAVQKGDFVKTKLFTPQALDVEQIVLHLIDEIGLSALRVQSVGDASQANTVFTMLVLNLDSFVFNLLISDESKDWDDYVAERKRIVDNWPLDHSGGRDPSIGQKEAAAARTLYGLTIRTWAFQRLFKLRRFSYFGVGWKKDQQPDEAKLEAADEEQEEQDTSEEI